MTSCELFIALIDNDCIQKSDAIILLEGDGFNRYQKAVDLYSEKWSNTIVFSGGITNYEYGSYPFNDVYPYIVKAGIPENAVIHEHQSQNTREQAVEVFKLAIAKSWKRLILVASFEHHYRAYLTFLREMLVNNSDILLFSSPVRRSMWFEKTGWGTRFDNLEVEFKKIAEYSKKGHIATFEQAIDYQKWKEKQLLK